MIEEIRNLLRLLGRTKIFALLVFIGLIGVLVARNIDFIDTLSFNVTMNNRGSDEQKNSVKIDEGRVGNSTGTHYVRIADVYLTPVKFKANHYLYVRIENSGTASLNDVAVKLDLGYVSAIDMAIRQDQECSFEGEGNSSIIKLSCPELKPKDIVDVQFFLDGPYFDQISVTASNLRHPEILTRSQYMEGQGVEGPPTFWEVLGYIVVVFFMILLGFKIVGRLFDI